MNSSLGDLALTRRQNAAAGWRRCRIPGWAGDSALQFEAVRSAPQAAAFDPAQQAAGGICAGPSAVAGRKVPKASSAVILLGGFTSAGRLARLLGRIWHGATAGTLSHPRKFCGMSPLHVNNALQR